MKVRAVCGTNMFDPVSLVNNKKLTDAEKQAIEAVHSAVEYNPHVPQYLLEQKPLILPGEHILRRGDSDAIAYGFWHIRHWKKIPGALTFLEYTWQSAFKNLPHHIDRGHRYSAYPAHNYKTFEMNRFQDIFYFLMIISNVFFMNGTNKYYQNRSTKYLNIRQRTIGGA